MCAMSFILWVLVMMAMIVKPIIIPLTPTSRTDYTVLKIWMIGGSLIEHRHHNLGSVRPTRYPAGSPGVVGVDPSVGIPEYGRIERM